MNIRENQFKRHKIPRKQPLPAGERLCLWMMMILGAALALVLLAQP